jgi:hypothetical protein
VTISTPVAGETTSDPPYGGRLTRARIETTTVSGSLSAETVSEIV